MNTSLPNEPLQSLRNYYESGTTHPYLFRKEQLLKLLSTIRQYEKEICSALYTDLKKSPEEAYATEIGLVYTELSYILKKLKSWMQPQSVPTNLLNIPSTSKIYRDPLGTVLIIAPWNYPFQLSIIPLIGAIAGGNCAVLKPSEFAPATSSILEKIIQENFSKDYISIVSGDGAEIIPAMMKSFRFDHIFYTGSIPVGKSICKMAAEDLVPVTLELGGKSPCIVESDANIAVAAQRIAFGKFTNAGQTCIAPDYVLAHTTIKDELIKKIIASIEKFYTPYADSAYDYGKIINEKRFDKLTTYLNEGNIIYGGQHDRSKLYIAPTVMDNISLNSPVMQEEIFGPILPIISFDTIVEAKQIVKQNENPLALYLFTTNKKTEQEWINNVAFGGGCINNADLHFTNHHLPFGGVGNSGMGAYHGKFTFDNFTRMKGVLKTPNWFNPAIKYPSFKGKLGLFKKVIR